MRVCSQCCESMSQTLTRESLEPDTRRPAPSPGRNATAVTASLWPCSRNMPDSATQSQTMISMSCEPDARSWPSALKATLAMADRCPSSATRSVQDARSHSRTVPSWWPDATSRWLGSAARPETSVSQSVSRIVVTALPVRRFQRISAFRLAVSASGPPPPPPPPPEPPLIHKTSVHAVDATTPSVPLSASTNRWYALTISSRTCRMLSGFGGICRI